MHDKKTFGINFRKAQKASGKKDQELAELLDISPQGVNAYANGRTYPSVSVLIRIAEVLDTSADRLLGLEEVELDIPDMVKVCYCKDCKKHNKGIEDVRLYGEACPLVRYRGRAQGHEFDYQWCVFGERKL